VRLALRGAARPAAQTADYKCSQAIKSREGACAHVKRRATMPKMKTKKAAAKRLTVRNSGSIKRGQATKRHLLTKRTTKSKRHRRGPVELHAVDVKSVRRMLPNA
jgi:large subunit ribosomal protein L35